MSMNPTLKTAWLAALRSGDYVQTTCTLKDDTGYCCLGVLCRVALDEDLLPLEYEVHEDPTKLRFVFIDEDDSYSDAKELAPGAFGIPQKDQLTLMGMNDGSDGMEKHSFTQIADWIEENL